MQKIIYLIEFSLLSVSWDIDQEHQVITSFITYVIEVDIRDIELMKVRENIAGTLLLAFKTPEEARRAVQILKLLGYDVKER